MCKANALILHYLSGLVFRILRNYQNVFTMTKLFRIFHYVNIFLLIYKYKHIPIFISPNTFTIINQLYFYFSSEYQVVSFGFYFALTANNLHLFVIHLLSWNQYRFILFFDLLTFDFYCWFIDFFISFLIYFYYLIFLTHCFVYFLFGTQESLLAVLWKTKCDSSN